MDTHNLDLETYSLEDLLALFELPSDWTASQLREAKKRALMMHPDKSRLPPEYFRFFMKAYGELEAVTRFRDRSQTKEVRRGEDIAPDPGLQVAIENSRKEGLFAEKFNALFEEHGLPLLDKQRCGGHGRWLSEDAGQQECADIEERRAQLRRSGALTTRPLSITGQAGSLLDHSEQDCLYQSDVFGKLRYDDVRHAHEESILPVTPADIDPRRPGSLSGLKEARSVLPPPMTRDAARATLATEERAAGAAGANRAFRLRREVEAAERASDAMRGKFLMLRR